MTVLINSVKCLKWNNTSPSQTLAENRGEEKTFQLILCTWYYSAVETRQRYHKKSIDQVPHEHRCSNP